MIRRWLGPKRLPVVVATYKVGTYYAFVPQLDDVLVTPQTQVEAR